MTERRSTLHRKTNETDINCSLNLDGTGIYDIDTDLFGSPPDVDGDPRIFIVLLDILDSPFTGTTFIGYFDTNNQSGQAMREIVYIDTNPLDVESKLARATLTHEFQHMLHWRGDPDEHKWIDEVCSEYAELACVYKDTLETAGETFLGTPNVSLTVWEDLPFDFDQTYLFMTWRTPTESPSNRLSSLPGRPRWA